MQVYSTKIIQFVAEIKRVIKIVVSQELHLEIYGDRFYDQSKRVSYPIKIVIYNDKSMLGYFDANFYELGFHERLMHTNKNQLHSIIRHELAHYLTFIKHGSSIQAHGPEFKALCQSLGWDEEIQRATTCLEEENGSPLIGESSVLRKVQKLMALANSSNKNEAEQAMIKSQQLLLKHNIEEKYVGSDEEKIYLKRIMKQKRKSAKMSCIALILETFFVSIVYNRGGEFICLEILGNSTNVEIAEYVATVLDTDLENLWDQARRQTDLKGSIAKNSFLMGIAKGYCNKIHALKRDYNPEVAKGLMVIEKQLVDAREMVYKRLSTSRSSAHYCPESSALGEKMGRKLNINPALNKASVPTHSLLSYFK